MVSISIVKNEKEEIEFLIDSITVAEILREYLNKDNSVKFAAWRKEHPNRPVVFRVETSGKTAKRAIEDAISQIEKETNELVAEVNKL
ncbi:MAG: RpoL/Rpb11 RNA polymerase subunit family protein [Candidatus Pacearchaeota archaeon]